MKIKSCVLKSLSIMTFTLVVILGIPCLAAAETQTVTWAYMSDAEPINWEENGVAKGVEVEIVNYILGKLGINVVHKFYPWKRAQLNVENGEADAMMTTPTTARFKYAVFGKENVLPNYWNLFIKKGNIKIAKAIKGMSKLEDLKPFELVDFIGNGWANAFMKSQNGYNIRKVARLGQLPTMLAASRCDLIINSSSWINWWAQKKGVQHQIEEHDIDWPMTRFHFVFMVSRKSSWIDKGLIKAMDEEIKKMKKSGAWHKILKKYKNPHGFGKPFISHLDKEYNKKHGFYKDYDSFPIYSP